MFDPSIAAKLSEEEIEKRIKTPLAPISKPGVVDCELITDLIKQIPEAKAKAIMLESKSHSFDVGRKFLFQETEGVVMSCAHATLSNMVKCTLSGGMVEHVKVGVDDVDEVHERQFGRLDEGEEVGLDPFGMRCMRRSLSHGFQIVNQFSSNSFFEFFYSPWVPNPTQCYNFTPRNLLCLMFFVDWWYSILANLGKLLKARGGAEVLEGWSAVLQAVHQLIAA